jgi:hypothetical protein
MSGLATIDITETVALTALRSFLVSILPSNVEVIRGQVNRVPSPKSSEFVVMTPTVRVRLETNRHHYTDQPAATPPVGTASIVMPTRETIQLDVHGLTSPNTAQIICALFRDPSTCDFFTALGLNIQPLYAEDPKQIPFETAEQQYDVRWVVDVVLQINPIITQSQQFADELVVGVFSADVEFPPT